MTQPRPSAAELLDAARTFLADEVVPVLEGRVQFHARVAVNVLATVERELQDGPVAADAERARLVELLGHEGELDDLVVELARGLRDRSVPIDDPALLAHLRTTAAADVAIANPRHVARPPEPTSI